MIDWLLLERDSLCCNKVPEESQSLDLCPVDLLPDVLQNGGMRYGVWEYRNMEH